MRMYSVSYRTKEDSPVFNTPRAMPYAEEIAMQHLWHSGELFDGDEKRQRIVLAQE